MCGIIGYAGHKVAAEVLMEGLARLEYRGYDSAGLAVRSDTGIRLCRRAGRVSALADALAEEPMMPSSVGIAHTRWATHGAPTEANAHPHRYGRVTLVHNGILENYDSWKRKLAAEGAAFASETDTEVLACLIDRAYRGDPVAAIRHAARQIEGSYALAILFDDRPGEIYGVRRGSPLLVGFGEGENLLASDRNALLFRTDRYTILNEGEIACVTGEGVTVLDDDGAPVEKPVFRSANGGQDAELGGYAHYMEKEMAEQPEAVARTLTACGAMQEVSFFRGAQRVVFLACGSAMHASLLGKRFFEAWAGIPAEVHVASEFRYHPPILPENTVAIAVSQSGETADTLAAVRLCRERGIPILGVVNVEGSSLATIADGALYTRAGTEIAVATTKAYSAQGALLARLAWHLSSERGSTAEGAPPFDALPAAMRLSEATVDACRAAAEVLACGNHAFFIGRGRDCPVCMEGALKLKEITYIHSEAYPAGELKHGTISLIDRGTPVLALITDRTMREKTVSNVKECRARGAYVILLVSEDVGEVAADAYDQRILLPRDLGELSVLPAAAVFQRIAYETALRLDRDVDKPRNLAKSVTVE